MMEEAGRTATLSKLISREKFYKEKALKLEKELIFSQEQVTAMQARIEDLNEKLLSNEENQSENISLQEELNQSKVALKEKVEQEKALLERIETLEAKTESDDVARFEEKIVGYETLLQEVERTINGKEKELTVLKKRLEQFENQSRRSASLSLMDLQKAEKNSDGTHTIQSTAISYSDHAVIFLKDSCLIRGDFVIENLGSNTLFSPSVCFKLNPIDAISLRGKLALNEGSILEGDSNEWSIVQNDWSEEAKERGEVWIAPTQAIKIEAGEQIRIPDLQFNIDTEFCKKVKIDAFVYFNDGEVRNQSMNPILLNFS